MAHYNLSVIYRKGEGVEKDEKKEIYHLEEAAIAGHPIARCTLAMNEGRNKRYERAVKHWIIAANLGCDDSVKKLKQFYVHGKVSKEDFAAALRAHQAAVDAMKSPQREAAAKAEATGEISWD
jgi:TPR repeat protein